MIRPVFIIYSIFSCLLNFAQNDTIPSVKMEGEVIKRMYVGKTGDTSDKIEFYFENKGQEYFIKLCENPILKDDLLRHFLNKKSIVEAKIQDGYRDICDPGKASQSSRTGKYIIIKSIMPKRLNKTE